MHLRIIQGHKPGAAAKAYTLEARLELDASEQLIVEQFGLGKELLYGTHRDSGAGVDSGPTITVNDVLRGRRLESKSLRTAMKARDTIVHACETLRELIDFAAGFDGVHSIDLGSLRRATPAVDDATGRVSDPSLDITGVNEEHPPRTIPEGIDHSDSTQNIRHYNGHNIVVHVQFGLYEVQGEGSMFESMAEAKAHIDSI
ncbi:MAG: hypothetical protein HOI95_13205 [Chromatiales bacterium]|nr:hypothetical protein [Chromatiales bacterium]